MSNPPLAVRNRNAFPKTREKLLQMLVQDKVVSTGILFDAFAGIG